MTSVQHEAKYEVWFQQQLSNMGTWEWNDTGVDVVLLDTANNDDVQIKRVVDFFAAVGVSHLREGNVTKLFDYDVNSLVRIICSSDWEMEQVLGVNGIKAHDSIREVLREIPLYKLLGAFSNERGIGVRKIKKLQQGVGAKRILDPTLTKAEISDVDGFDEKTAVKVLKAIEKFRDFQLEIVSVCQVSTEDEVDADGILADKKICMTGFRDKALSEKIEELGGTIQSGVSGKTDVLVTTNPSSNSGKAKKARDLGIKIMSVDDFKDMIG